MLSTEPVHSASEQSIRIERLAVFPDLAADRADPAWLRTLQHASDVEVPAETVLMCRGDKCSGFLLPWRGTIRVQHTSEDGREAVLYRVEAGDICILALTSLLDGADYSAEAVTETCVKGVSIPLEHFNYALDHSPVFRNYVFGVMARRLRTLCSLVGQVMFRRLDNRMACLLYQLFSRSSAPVINMTHQELAHELGSSREVVSRLLKDLEKRVGCIALHRGRIELLSLEKLGHYARQSAS